MQVFILWLEAIGSLGQPAGLELLPWHPIAVDAAPAILRAEEASTEVSNHYGGSIDWSL